MNTSEIKEKILKEAFNIIVKNLQFFEPLSPIFDRWDKIGDKKLAERDIMQATKMGDFVSGLLNNPLYYVLPDNKKVEYCLKAIMLHYRDYSFSSERDRESNFIIFMNNIQYNGWNPIESKPSKNNQK